MCFFQNIGQFKKNMYWPWEGKIQTMTPFQRSYGIWHVFHWILFKFSVAKIQTMTPFLRSFVIWQFFIEFCLKLCYSLLCTERADMGVWRVTDHWVMIGGERSHVQLVWRSKRDQRSFVAHEWLCVWLFEYIDVKICILFKIL